MPKKKEKKKKEKTMIEVTKHYEEFISQKDLNESAADLFDKVLKEAVKTKASAPKQSRT